MRQTAYGGWSRRPARASGSVQLGADADRARRPGGHAQDDNGRRRPLRSAEPIHFNAEESDATKRHWIDGDEALHNVPSGSPGSCRQPVGGLATAFDLRFTRQMLDSRGDGVRYRPVPLEVNHMLRLYRRPPTRGSLIRRRTPNQPCRDRVTVRPVETVRDTPLMRVVEILRARGLPATAPAWSRRRSSLAPRRIRSICTIVLRSTLSGASLRPAGWRQSTWPAKARCRIEAKRGPSCATGRRARERRDRRAPRRGSGACDDVLYETSRRSTSSE